MQGAVFISHQNGWACSNEVVWRVEQDIIKGENGEKVSKRINTLKISAIFNGKSTVEKGLAVDCVFKQDETDKKYGFVGEVTGMTKDTILILLKAKTERIEQILTKIKEEI